VADARSVAAVLEAMERSAASGAWEPAGPARELPEATRSASV
jgi:hypothetical protein